jgi:hypothetical protein
MTFRDLTDDQRDTLIRQCEEMFNYRNKGRREDQPFRWEDYRMGFSDGVMKTLKPLKTYGTTT